MSLFVSATLQKPCIPACFSQGGIKQSRNAVATSGQALLELTLVVPLLFLLIVNVVNFGAFFYAWITIADAARAGSQYAAAGSVSFGSPGAPTGTQIAALITQDAASLPNAASLVINVCQNNNGTVTTIRGTCSGVAADPEPATYILESVDVTYTYQPYIPLYSFPALGIHATLPTTSIHRSAAMRVLK